MKLCVFTFSSHFVCSLSHLLSVFLTTHNHLLSVCDCVRIRYFVHVAPCLSQSKRISRDFVVCSICVYGKIHRLIHCARMWVCTLLFFLFISRIGKSIFLFLAFSSLVYKSCRHQRCIVVSNRKFQDSDPIDTQNHFRSTCYIQYRRCRRRRRLAVRTFVQLNISSKRKKNRRRSPTITCETGDSVLSLCMSTKCEFPNEFSGIHIKVRNVTLLMRVCICMRMRVCKWVFNEMAIDWRAHFG